MVQLVLNAPSFDRIRFDGDRLAGAWQMPMYGDTRRPAHISHEPRDGRAPLPPLVPMGRPGEPWIGHDELSGPRSAPGMTPGVKGDQPPAQADLGSGQPRCDGHAAQGGEQIGRGGHDLGGGRVHRGGHGRQEGVRGAEQLAGRTPRPRQSRSGSTGRKVMSESSPAPTAASLRMSAATSTCFGSSTSAIST